MAKRKRKPDDKEQSKRFIEKAKEVAGEDADNVFDEAIKKMLPSKGDPS